MMIAIFHPFADRALDRPAEAPFHRADLAQTTIGKGHVTYTVCGHSPQTHEWRTEWRNYGAYRTLSDQV